MTSIQEGSLIAGKYRVERALAQGGMGSIWVARHVQLDSLVAIKLMDPACASTDEGRARFEQEARAAALLQSPHVVRVSDFGVEGNTPYMVMELLQGEDLGQCLRRVRRLPLRTTAVILTHAARALRKAHDAGIVHRDLKPANLFIAQQDDEQIIKVLDFGIAKQIGLGEARDTTRTGVVLGSVHYMSPEQARGYRHIDHRSDLWALGVIAFRALTGRVPFPGKEAGDVIVKICSDPIPKASEIAPDLGPAIDAFFARALARDRDQRFQSAVEMAAVFAALAGLGRPCASGVDAAPDSARPTLPPVSNRLSLGGIASGGILFDPAASLPPETGSVSAPVLAASTQGTLTNAPQSADAIASESRPRRSLPRRVVAGALILLSISLAIALFRGPPKETEPRAARSPDLLMELSQRPDIAVGSPASPGVTAAPAPPASASASAEPSSSAKARRPPRGPGAPRVHDTLGF
jgi:serine/threonine-protein kinase